MSDFVVNDNDYAIYVAVLEDLYVEFCASRAHDNYAKVDGYRQFCWKCSNAWKQDYWYFVHRMIEEGEEFATLTLPSLDRGLTQALARGYILESDFTPFRRKGVRPKFMGTFFRAIFDRDGVIRDHARFDLSRPIWAIRQASLFYSKMEVKVSPQRVELALDAYVSTDMQIPDLSNAESDAFAQAAQRYLGKYLSAVARELFLGRVRMRHASGALATRETYNQRFSNRVWTSRLQHVLPFWDYLCVGYTDAMSADVSLLEREQEPPCRVTTVPKTAKGPRIIAMEPVYNQYVQQGILTIMTDVLKRPQFRHLAEVFDWTDQERNRQLARIGSIDGGLATLDLSEASDRVSLQLVRRLPFGALLEEAILACRSEFASVPGRGTIELKKFASMGSSLCFPIETLVFYVLARMALDAAAVSRNSTSGDGEIPVLSIYGDDIIVPTDNAELVIDTLEAYGLKVNTNKSFYRGLFRESCGADWYAGNSVSVIRQRARLDHDSHWDQLTKGIELHNRLYEAGLDFAAEQVRTIFYEAGHRVPSIPFGSRAGLGFWTMSDNHVEYRTNRKLHRREYRAWSRRETKPYDPLSDYGALRKFFIVRDSSEFPIDEGHLTRDGRSRCAGMNIVWVEDRL